MTRDMIGYDLYVCSDGSEWYYFTEHSIKLVEIWKLMRQNEGVGCKCMIMCDDGLLYQTGRGLDVETVAAVVSNKRSVPNGRNCRPS